MAQSKKSSISELTRLPSSRNLVKLSLKEQPARGRASRLSRKGRGPKWPIEPPPVIELSLASMAPKDMSSVIINSPNYFCTAELKPVSGNMTSDELIEGNTVASLTRVKVNNTEHGIFVFNDIHVKDAGEYSLVFTMFEMRPHYNNVFAEKVTSIQSNVFKIHENPKDLGPPVRPSTFVSALMESGVRIKIRKDAPRRKKQAQDWGASDIATAAIPAPTTFSQRGIMHAPGSSIPSLGEDISGRLRHNPMHPQMMPTMGSMPSHIGYSFQQPVMTPPGTMPPSMISNTNMAPFPMVSYANQMPYHIPNPMMHMTPMPERPQYPMVRSEHVEQYVQPQVSNTQMQPMYSNNWSNNSNEESFENQVPSVSNASEYTQHQGPAPGSNTSDYNQHQTGSNTSEYSHHQGPTYPGYGPHGYYGPQRHQKDDRYNGSNGS